MDKNVPAVRFDEFDVAWLLKPLNQVVDVCSGRDYKHLSSGDIPVYGTGGYMTSVDQALSQSTDAIGIGRKGTINNPYLLEAPFWTVDTLFYALANKGFNLQFIFRLFENIDWKKHDESTGVPSLSKEAINRIEVFTASEAEQTKIGAWFKALDGLIALQQRKHDKLATLKQAMLQKMFPKPGATTPEIRFKGFEGDWRQKKLEDLASKNTRKNSNMEFSETLTNSAEFGVITQADYFDKSISNVKNLGGYFVVQPDDFVYNPRISSFAPVGPVNRNKLNRAGVMSPLYTVLTITGIDKTFLEYFFKTRIWHPYMFFNGDTGARSDRFSIKDHIFMAMPVPFPDPDEQQKIGQYFQNLDTLITQHATQLIKLKQLKAAFLDRMFV